MRTKKLLNLCLSILLFPLFISACGGGGAGGSPNSSSSNGSPTNNLPTSSAPRITASIGSFAAEEIPSQLLSHGGTTLAVVSVNSATTGDPINAAKVEVNGTLLNYAVDLKVYRGWLILEANQSVALKVEVNGSVYSTNARQAPTFPQIISPPPERQLSGQLRVRLLRSNETLVTWGGILPNNNYRYAALVLDEQGELSWPSRSTFQIFQDATLRQSTIPSNAVPKGFSTIATGITQTVDISNAASQSTLTVGNFSQSPVFVVDTNQSTLSSLKIEPNKLTLGLQSNLQLVARGTYSDNSDQDLTNRVTWTSDTPNIVNVSPTGRLTGISIGTSKIKATLGTISTITDVSVIVKNNSENLDEAITYQINTNHSGHIDFPSPLSFPQSKAWSIELPGYLSYPLIAKGNVYVLSGNNTLYEGRGTNLFALDQNTGNIKWGPIQIDEFAPWSGHCYDQNKIFALNSRGILKALNADTGVVSWSLSIPENVQDTWGFSVSPVARNGIVYVIGSGVNSTLIAIEESSGRILWKTPNIKSVGTASPVVTDDAIYISGYLQTYRLDPITGSFIWHFSGNGSGGGSLTPALYKGKLYIRDYSDPFSRILNSSTGEEAGPAGVAQGQNVGLSRTTPISTFYLDKRFELNQSTLYAIDTNTNKVIWSFKGNGQLISAPISVNQTIFVASSDGIVFGIDSNTGIELWQGKTGYELYSSDEHNVAAPMTGLAAARGLIIIPAGKVLTAFRLNPN